MNHQRVLAIYIPLLNIKQSWDNIYPYGPSNSLGQIYTLLNHQTVEGGTPPTPKKAGKLKTAISRPFLVQMSWFFAWDFVITYSVRKISHQPPDQPPAQPPVRAATRPTTFRQKLSDSADICRVGWQSYNSASYKKLALTELKRPRNRPANTIYSLRRALSRPFWFGLG